MRRVWLDAAQVNYFILRGPPVAPLPPVTAVDDDLSEIRSLSTEQSSTEIWSQSVLRIRIRIRIRRIPMFLGLLDPDPDPLVRGMDPDPSIIKQKL
jgi:hypothetical protein